MSSELTFDGKNFLPATEAGKHFEYTKDYLLLLIKEGKISGKKIGHRWYVDMASAEHFFIEAKKVREKRKAKIREERREELRAHTAVRPDLYRRRAVVETLVILIIGLSVGAVGYLGSNTYTASLQSAHVSFFENLAVSLYTLVAGNETRTHESVPAINLEGQKTSSTITVPHNEASAISTRVGTTTVTSLVIAPDEVFSTSTVESVQNSFSDEVEVMHDPKNPKTGIITPVFKETKGEPYRFLMVPVTEAKTQ